MSYVPTELKYTKEHEWLRLEGDEAVIGITDHAQESLGDVTFVELPAIGERYETGETFGVVESVKAASDLYMPLAGEIIATNQALDDQPQLVNTDCYGQAWMIRLRLDNPADATSLLDSTAYEAIL